MLERPDGEGRSSTDPSAVGELGDLLPPETRRWVARRKAQVVAAVRGGRLSFEDACRRYNISREEFASWERAMDRHGVRGLRITRLQEFRDPSDPQR